MSEAKQGISEQALIEAGYIKHLYNFSTGHNADALYQKCFRTERGKRLFFINFYQYKRLYDEGALRRDGWQPEVQFKLSGDDHLRVNLTMLFSDSVEQVERFVEKAYRVLECLPYDDED